MPRNNCLKEKILQFCPDSSKTKLKYVCRTRWVERIEGMGVFEVLFVPVYHSFLTMKENNNIVHYHDETSAKAESLFKVIYDFEFIITLVITHSILNYLLPATRKLQSKDLDVAKSADITCSLKSSIQNLRTSVDEYSSKWYNDALNLAEKVDIKESDIKKPQTCSKQTYRSNHLIETTKNYFKGVLTITFLDHVLTDHQHRFPGNELVPYRGLYLIPCLVF